jgi:hypothetical protein
MFTRPMRGKPQAELLHSARPTCAPSIPGGQHDGPAASSRLEAGNVAIWRRLDRQLPYLEATS